MNYSVEWDNPQKTVIRVTLKDGVTVKEVMQALEDGAPLISSVDHSVDYLLDFRISKVPDRWLTSFPEIAQHPAINHPNRRLQVVITNQRLVRTLGSIFSKVFSNKGVMVVDSEEEAYATIEEANSARVL